MRDREIIHSLVDSPNVLISHGRTRLEPRVWNSIGSSIWVSVTQTPEPSTSASRCSLALMLNRIQSLGPNPDLLRSQAAFQSLCQMSSPECKICNGGIAINQMTYRIMTVQFFLSIFCFQMNMACYLPETFSFWFVILSDAPSLQASLCI